MSEGRSAAGVAQRVGSGTSRLVRAWRALPHESRLAGFASIGLFLTLFLPWYQVTLIDTAKTSKLQSASATITGWGAFSFVEAAVLIVAAGVLTLLLQRAEGRAFHLPGGDGGVIMAAGLWTCVLIVWRIFDKQGATTNGPSATTSGIEWGIFIALAAAAFLAYSGSRIRAAHRPEPPLPGEKTAPVGSNAAANTAAPTPAPEAVRRLWDTPAPPRTWSDTSAPPRSVTETLSRSRTPVPPRRRPLSSQPLVADSAADRPAPPSRPARNTHAPPPAPVRAPATDPSPAAKAAPAALDPAARRHDVPPPATPEPATQALPDRPRRRASAADLFERVVPDDPPTMPFGRAKPADFDETLRMPSASSAGEVRERPPDEQMAMPLGNDDDTLSLGDDDDTLRLNRD